MPRPNKITLLFFFIFILGVIGTLTYINKTINKKSEINPLLDKIETRDTSVTFQE